MAKRQKTREYIVRIDLHLSGACVFVDATSPEEAERKVKAGEWDHEEMGGASWDDWRVTDVEENV